MNKVIKWNNDTPKMWVTPFKVADRVESGDIVKVSIFGSDSMDNPIIVPAALTRDEACDLANLLMEICDRQW